MPEFLGTPPWELDEAVIEVSVDGRLLDLYNDFLLEEIRLRGEAVVLSFKPYRDLQQDAVWIRFEQVSDLSLDREGEVTHSRVDALLEYRSGFSNLQFLYLTGIDGSTGTFEIHFSDMVLRLLAEVVRTGSGTS